MKRVGWGVLATSLAILAAGCGGDDGKDSPAQGASTPQQTLRDVQKALAGVRSLHLEGTATDKDGAARFRGDVSSDARVRFRISHGQSEAEIVAIGTAVYLKGNRAFLTTTAGAPPALASQLANRWLKAPPDDDLSRFAERFSPRTLAHCLGGAHGKLSDRGTQSLDGEQVRVIADDGSAPGTAPGELYVATSGPALPLRLRQTGATKPGGTPDPRCDEGDDTTTAEDVRLSRFDEPVDIQAPRGALDLGALSQPDDGTRAA